MTLDMIDGSRNIKLVKMAVKGNLNPENIQITVQGNVLFKNITDITQKNWPQKCLINHKYYSSVTETQQKTCNNSPPTDLTITVGITVS